MAIGPNGRNAQNTPGTVDIFASFLVGFYRDADGEIELRFKAVASRPSSLQNIICHGATFMLSTPETTCAPQKCDGRRVIVYIGNAILLDASLARLSSCI
eukprot:4388969-Amphidinium_carterae.1